MTDALLGAFERVRRTEKHLAELRQLLAGLKPQEDLSAFEADLDEVRELPAGVTLRMPLTALVSTLIGEICYNLRSALDYLVFELAKIDSGIAQEGTQFPIEDAKKGFEHRVKTGRLKGINAAHVAQIERLQPYEGCDWTKTLRDVSNPDKHRELATLGAELNLVVYLESEDPRFAEIPLPVQRAPHPITLEVVNMKVHGTGEILFRDRTPVIETLEIIKLKVAETLAAFEPEFER